MRPEQLTSWQQRNMRIPNPQQYTSLLKKTMSSKSKLLKQLQQLNIDITQLSGLSLKELIEKCDSVFRNTYSFKYIGVKDNQIGILSKRLKPNSLTADILPDIENRFLVTDFFFPKPLKTITKPQDKQSSTVENVIKFNNPNTRRKATPKTAKVKGGWMNMKHRLGHPMDRSSPDADSSLFQQKPFNNSYSRTLQKLSKNELEILPGKTLYSTISQPGKDEEAGLRE